MAKDGTLYFSSLKNVMNRHYNASLCILGIYEGSIYSFYGYFEHKLTGLNFEEAKRKLSWHAYPTETQEMSETAAELTDIVRES